MVHLIGLGDRMRAALYLADLQSVRDFDAYLGSKRAAWYLADLQPRQWFGSAARTELSGAAGRLAEWLEDAISGQAGQPRREWAGGLLALRAGSTPGRPSRLRTSSCST